MVQLPAAELHVTWRDESGSRATPYVYMRIIEASAALNAAAGLVGVMDAVTGCTCTGYRVSYPFHIGDQAASGTQPENYRGLFVFQCEGTGKYLTLAVPCIKQSVIEPQSPGMDIVQTAPAVQALIQAVIGGSFCNPFGYQAIALESAFVQFIP